MNSTTYGVDEYGNDAGLVSSGYVGEIKMFGFSGVPAHCLACDGSLISIAAYPELYAKLGTLYGGDGIATFALPTAEDVIYAAGNGRAVGAAVADGLPDIEGAITTTNIITFATLNGTKTYGGFEVTVQPGGSLPGGQTDRQQINGFRFKASNANPIYGTSTHVQPKGTAFNFCIVYE